MSYVENAWWGREKAEGRKFSCLCLWLCLCHHCILGEIVTYIISWPVCLERCKNALQHFWLLRSCAPFQIQQRTGQGEGDVGCNRVELNPTDAGLQLGLHWTPLISTGLNFKLGAIAHHRRSPLSRQLPQIWQVKHCDTFRYAIIYPAETGRSLKLLNSKKKLYMPLSHFHFFT